MSAVIESAVLRFDRFGETSRQCAAEIDQTVHQVLTAIRQEILEEEHDAAQILHCTLSSLENEVQRHRGFLQQRPPLHTDADHEAWYEEIRADLVRLWGRIEAYALVARWAVCIHADLLKREANGEIQ